MDSYAVFGDFIRAERDRAEMGLREGARALGISASYLSRLEAGEFRPPSGAVLMRMARLYGSDMRILLDKAKSREHEVMAADTSVAPAVQAFYRLAHDQTPEVQERMLNGAIDALDMPQEQKEQLLAQLRAALSRNRGKDLPRRANGADGLFAFDIAPRVLSRAQIRKLARNVLRTVFGTKIPIPVPIETVVRRFDQDIILIVHDEVEGGRLRDGSPAVLGLSRWSHDGRRRELVVHEDLFDADDAGTRRRANFTIGHELFHCVEHLPLAQRRCPQAAFARSVSFVSFSPRLFGKRWFETQRKHKKLSTNEDWREWQANEFAAELLMPAETVASMFEVLFSTTQIKAQGIGTAECADRIARRTIINDLGGGTSLVDRFDVNPQAMAIRLMNLGLVVGLK